MWKGSYVGGYTDAKPTETLIGWSARWTAIGLPGGGGRGMRTQVADRNLPHIHRHHVVQKSERQLLCTIACHVATGSANSYRTTHSRSSLETPNTTSPPEVRDFGLCNNVAGIRTLVHSLRAGLVTLALKIVHNQTLCMRALEWRAFRHWHRVA